MERWMKELTLVEWCVIAAIVGLLGGLIMTTACTTAAIDPDKLATIEEEGYRFSYSGSYSPKASAFRLEDGTRCVAFYSGNGAAIDCEWETK